MIFKSKPSRVFTRLSLGVLSYSAVLHGQEAANHDQPVEEKPNIVIILADDMGWGDVGFHSVRDIMTPNIDKLAAQGVHFSQGYVSASVCAPSRAGLLTGVYQQRLCYGENGSPGLTRTQPLLSELLKPLGYRCGAIGKWHLGEEPGHQPNDRGFDYYYGFLGGAHDYCRAELNASQKSLAPMYRNRQPEAFRGYLTDTFTDEAVRFIQRNHTKPFFLYLAYNAVHHPWQVPQKYLERTRHISPIPDRAFFAAMVLAMDDGVGRVMQTLKSCGVDEKTIIIFLSDNGTPMGQGLKRSAKQEPVRRGHTLMSSPGPFRGFKGDTFEGGIRVPFIIRWPGKISPGTCYEQPVSSLDIVPTLLAQFHIQRPPSGYPFDGVNLLPYLQNPQKTDRPHTTFYWRRDNDYAIRHHDWKLEWNERGSEKLTIMLFDLKKDPGEYTDRCMAFPALAQKLQDMFDDWDSRLPDNPQWGGPWNRNRQFANGKRTDVIEFNRNPPNPKQARRKIKVPANKSHR